MYSKCMGLGQLPERGLFCINTVFSVYLQPLYVHMVKSVFTKRLLCKVTQVLIQTAEHIRNVCYQSRGCNSIKLSEILYSQPCSTLEQ